MCECEGCEANLIFKLNELKRVTEKYKKLLSKEFEIWEYLEGKCPFCKAMSYVASRRLTDVRNMKENRTGESK